MAFKSKCNMTCAIIVFIWSVLNVSASRLDEGKGPLPVAREKRTITVLARGLADIFGLDVGNGQSSTGVTKPTTSNPLVLTYPPERVPTKPYQQLNYPTTTPAPAPITYHPAITLPPLTTRPPTPGFRDELNAPNSLPTSRPAFLTPKRLITLRPAALSPTRIITTKPISINTYLQTERAETHSATLDAKKEVVLIGIPVTIHKVGGINLGLFNGGNDEGQLKHFQNVYKKSKAKDIESVEQTRKVKENTFKNVEDFGTPNKDVKNVGLVDDYEQYSKRIRNKLKTQSSSEQSHSNNEFTTSSSPYKYDEFDIPDVAAHDAGNHQDNEEYSNKESERETWKFYKEESKNNRPPVKHQVDSETRGQKGGKDQDYDGEEKKRGHDHSTVDYELYKDLKKLKDKGNGKEPKKKYRDSEKKHNSVRHEEEKYNPSYEEHGDFEHQHYNNDDRDPDNGNTGSKEEGYEGYGSPYYKDSSNNDVQENNSKGRDNISQGHEEKHRESMEDNMWKHRHVGDRETDYRHRERHREEERGQDNKNRYTTPDSERGYRDEGTDQKHNHEETGGEGGHGDHAEVDYGRYKDDWNQHEEKENGSNQKHTHNKGREPQRGQEYQKETDATHKGIVDGREEKHNQGPQHGYKNTQNKTPQNSEEFIQETHEKPEHEGDGGSGYGHYRNNQEDKHRHAPKDRYKTPKDERRNPGAGRQQENKEESGGNPRQVDQISWDYGPSGAERDSREKGFGDSKTQPNGWKHQENQVQDAGAHSKDKQNPFNYEQNAWDNNHNPSHGLLQNGSSQSTDNAEKPKPDLGIGPPHGNPDVFDYNQYTKNHGVHGFQFPSPYENLHSPPENFWGPTPQSAIHPGSTLPGGVYQPQLYSYDSPGYFGPFRQTNYQQHGQQHGHSFVPDPHFNPHAVATEPPGTVRKGPQRRTEDSKLDRTKSEVDELASDGLSSELQRDVPARGSRPKKSDTEGNGWKSSQAGNKGNRYGADRIESLTRDNGKNGVKSDQSFSRPRTVLQAIQQIENNRRPQLWPSPFDAATDSSRHVTLSSTSKLKNPKQQPIPNSKNLNHLAQNEQLRGNNENRLKFDPFKTKPNEKVELKFGWPRSFLKKDSPQQRSQTQGGDIKRDGPTYTKNPKTSYQADAELYDFGKFNKNTGRYDVQGSVQKHRNQS